MTLISHPDIKEGSIEQCLKYFEEKEIISVDTETQGLDPYSHKILTLQLGDFQNQFVIDVQTVDIQMFKELLETKILIFQNAKFDLGFLYHQRIVPKRVKDTYLAECILYTGDKTVRKGLDVLVKRYLDVDLDKSIRGIIHRVGLSTAVIKYAAGDVKYLEDLIDLQEAALEKEDLMKVYMLENEFVRILAYIEYSGFKINIPKWKKKMKEDKILLLKSEKGLNSWIEKNLPKYMKLEVQMDLFNPDSGKPQCKINWSSPQQVVEVFKDLGVETLTWDKNNGKMRDSIEEDRIKPQRDKTPLIDLFLLYQKYKKITSTYGENILKQIHPDGRLRTQFTQIMNTGRISSGGGKGKVKFTNFQNIPRVPENRDKEVYARECFTCEENNNLVVSDYSGQEQIVFANFSLDKKILGFYDEGFSDMHSFVAQKMYRELKDLSHQEIKRKHGEKRYIAKTCGFALLYGGNAITLSRNLSIPIKEGENIYNSYFGAFPGIKKYFKRVSKKALEDGYILHNNILGRKTRISFFDEFKEKAKTFDDDYWETYREEKKNRSEVYKNVLKREVREHFKEKGQIERMSYNYPIQGTSADITKVACIKLFKWLENEDKLFNVWLPSVVHDEIVCECEEKDTEEIKNKLQEAMEEAGKIYCKRVKLTATPVVTKVWEH